MEACGSSMFKNNNTEIRALEGLLDAFGSLFSLEQIASTYCKAGQNVDLAGAILYDMHKRTSISNSESKNESSSVSLCVHASNGEVPSENNLESSNGVNLEKISYVNENSKTSKRRNRPISVGTISSVLGKSYVNSTTPTYESSIATKPLKLDSKDFLVSEFRSEESSKSSTEDDNLHNDIGDFLFKMLGGGFQLDKDMVREVLGCCGYDMRKSMEKLIDLSAVTLDKRDDFFGEVTETSTDKDLREWKERSDLQKEVLVALFHASERHEESPRRTVTENEVKRSRASRQLVVEPLCGTNVEHKAVSMINQRDIKDDDGDDDYRVLRGAVKEYRATMKEYYKAAVEAFAGGDRVRAGKLLEEGHFFHRKAREADEESVQKIFVTRNVEAEDAICLDLHNHTGKEAIRLLKCHLSSLCGIPSMKYLKVIMETNEEDISKGACKRLIIKLLEKESIKWIEEGNAGTILICLDEINPKNLSFSKKK